MIELRGVGKTLGAGVERVEALDAIDLSIGAGEFTGLVGPSGSGKTTLLNILGLLDRPSRGTLTIEGREVSQLTAREASRLRAARIGFVFQNFNLLGALTARENVEFPLRLARVGAAERRARALEALARVGIAEKAERLPEQLSAGEKQRVAIARALVHRPLYVLADEPTANLDSANGDAIVALLVELNRDAGTTFVIATHDRDLVARLPRVIPLKDGRLV